MFSIILGASNIDAYSRNLLNDKSLIIKKNAEADFLLSNFYQENFEDTYLVDNLEDANSDSDANVLISEIVIEGWEDHSEGRKLELAAYDAISIKPGSILNNQILKQNLDSIYASGWFSGVKFKAEDGSLAVSYTHLTLPTTVRV